MKKIKFLQFLTILLIITSKVSAEDDPIITCEQDNQVYTCKFYNFNITSSDYRFQPSITHTLDHTNSDVQKVFATKPQTISNFPIEIFQTFPNVKFVELVHVKMTELDKNLINCDKLEWFDLQHNNLYKISSGIFKNCVNLFGLEFGFNKISSISEDAFYGLPKIKTLDFDNNLLVDIPENLLIESIDLDHLRLIQSLQCFQWKTIQL